MTEPAVRTTGLTKRYGDRVALDGVDLEVPVGTVYGLVGPNGAGKTTLLSILAGLRRPSGGRVAFGIDPRRIGVLPDTPRFDPWLTGTEVVDLARALTSPPPPPERVAEALSVCGLAEAAVRRVGGYSRGMLQRLGLAATMVGEPDLLILDEPSSALDPAGRKEVLDLVATLGRRATVLFSSHILADVERVCETVGVLRDGRLLFQGPLERLLSDGAPSAVVVRVRPPTGPLAALLRAQPWVREVEEREQGEVRVDVTAAEDAERLLAGVLADAGARLLSIEPAARTLEEVFLAMTEEPAT